MTHTPGPWRLEGWKNVVNGDNIPVLEHEGHIPENARLIAAAPALLEALEAVRHTGGAYYTMSKAMQAKVDTAIALAKGESK